jgi:hypothetical protein
VTQPISTISRLSCGRSQNHPRGCSFVPLHDVASHFHLMEKYPSAMCPNTFLTLFNLSYPLPQKQNWTNVQPPLGLWSHVISMLRGQPLLGLRQWTTELAPPPGTTGQPILENVRSIPSCASCPDRPNKPTSLPLPPGFALVSLGKQSNLDPSKWKKPSVTYRKSLSWLGTTTPAKPMDPKSLICRSDTSSKATRTKTRHQNAN